MASNQRAALAAMPGSAKSFMPAAIAALTKRSSSLVCWSDRTRSFISAIDNEGGLAFQVFKGGFKVPVFIGFLKRLIEHGKGRKIFLILDQHPVHKSKAVQSWVEERADEIEIFFMPGYSPELNPDE
jgi:hypothetical protein